MWNPTCNKRKSGKPGFLLVSALLKAISAPVISHAGLSGHQAIKPLALFDFLDLGVHHIVVGWLGFWLGCAWSTGCAACSCSF